MPGVRGRIAGALVIAWIAGAAPSGAAAQNAATREYVAGNLHAQREDYASAIEAYRRSIAQMPTARAFGSLGIVCYASGRYAEAAEALREASRLTPADAGRLEAAAAEFELVLALAPDRAEYLYRVGVTLARLGRQDEAEEVQRQLVPINAVTARKLREAIDGR